MVVNNEATKFSVEKFSGSYCATKTDCLACYVSTTLPGSQIVDRIS